jgi:hypothetical protein
MSPAIGAKTGTEFVGMDVSMADNLFYWRIVAAGPADLERSRNQATPSSPRIKDLVTLAAANSRKQALRCGKTPAHYR